MPSGAISVMPQACVTCSPWRRSKPSIIDRGAAEPPTIIARSFERSYFSGSASSVWRMPIQIVGTPAVIVTFSCTNASSRLGGSRCGPGKTCVAPTSVHVNGKPQAFAWNIGTTGRITSVSATPSVPDCVEASEWIAIARCE